MSKPRRPPKPEVTTVSDVREMRPAYLLHQVSRRIVDENQVLVTETLNVRGMVRNRRLPGKALVRQIASKAQWAQRTHLEVDPWFPSSRCCSACHAVWEDLTLTDRHWRCEACGRRFFRSVSLLDVCWRRH